MLPEVRMSRIEDAIGLHRSKKLSCAEVADLLGCSERHFLRLRNAYGEGGAVGIIDRRRGRASGRRAEVGEVEFVVGEYRDRYFDFRPKHFHEEIAGKPMSDGKPFCRGYTWTKSVLQRRGLVSKGQLRGPHRKKRERRPLPGMLLFQDGSQHQWLADGPPLDLIVTMDDATSWILSIFLVEEEGTASSFRGLAETIAAHGLFSCFYTDRGSHYFFTPKAGEKVDTERLTQVGRALQELHIGHIPSYSPQARGRIERLWDTLQNRLPQLLRLNGLATIETANRWLADVYMTQHNARFGVKPAEDGSAFLPFVGDLDDILCVREERVVQNDNTVRYDGLVLQIQEQRHRRHFVKQRVRVHAYPDGSLAIFHGPRKLARYRADGVLLADKNTAKSAA